MHEQEKLAEVIQLFPVVHSAEASYAFDGANALQPDLAEIYYFPDPDLAIEETGPVEASQTQDRPNLYLVPDLHVEIETEPEPEPEPDPRLVIDASELDIDERDYWRIVTTAGKLSVSSEVAKHAVESEPENLKADIKRANQGDQIARQRVEVNCHTDAVERSYKEGVIIPIPLDTNRDGQINQWGQALQRVHENAIAYNSEHPVMKQRAEIEARNGLRLQKALDEGMLEDYAFVTFSLVPNKLSRAEAHKLKFFTETMSAAIQVTTIVDGQLKMESAFVAGIEDDSADRHDLDAVVSVGEEFGIDYSGLDSEEILSQPILIHKSLIPNLSLDLVIKYDQEKGTLFGKNNHGKSTSLEEYKKYKLQGDKLQNKMQAVSAKIADRLISEAEAINTPVQAVRRLDKISEEETLIHSLTETSINPIVFGSKSASYIMQGRISFEQGNWYEMQQYTAKALKTADSSSCPSSLMKESSMDQINIEGVGMEDSNYCVEIKDGQIVKCPGCKEMVKAIVPNRESIYCPNKKCGLTAPWLKDKKIEKPKKDKNKKENDYIFRMNCEPEKTTA